MIMIATVLRTEAGSLLVRDLRTGEEVRVITSNAWRFRRGDRIRITYSGAMTRSIPPQITATSIRRIQIPSRLTPREIIAVILQRRGNSLVVRDANNNEIIVHYPQAHRFRTGEQIRIRHDRESMVSPREVNATEIIPVS